MQSVRVKVRFKFAFMLAVCSHGVVCGYRQRHVFTVFRELERYLSYSRDAHMAATSKFLAPVG